MPEQKQVEIKADAWDYMLDEDEGPAAIVIRERLRPAAGLGFPVAPPTFAESKQGKIVSVYHYDGEDPGNWENVRRAQAEGRVANRCTLDSIPSQANRMESMLKRFEGSLIPKVTLTGAKHGTMSLLDIGHRVADAAMQFSDDYTDFQNALEAYVQGDALPLARIAPTSLVFGFWDSRGTTAGKARRLIRGEIFAENVVKLSKRIQYWASVDPEASEDFQKALDEARARENDDQEKDVGSQLGFRDAFASGLGGVIAHGDILRLTILSLTGLRNLRARSEAPTGDGSRGIEKAEGGVDDTTKLRRYLFALMLASVSTPGGGWDLREGCMLVQRRRKTDTGGDEPDIETKSVFHDGREQPWRVPSAPELEAYLKATAHDLFGRLPEERNLTFAARTAAERVREKLKEKDRSGTDGIEGAQSKSRKPRAGRRA